MKAVGRAHSASKSFHPRFAAGRIQPSRQPPVQPLSRGILWPVMVFDKLLRIQSTSRAAGEQAVE